MLEEKAALRVPPSIRLEAHEKEIAELHERVVRLEAWIIQILGLDVPSQETIPR